MLMDLLNTNNGYCYRVCRYILDICVACCRQVPWRKQGEYSAIPRGCSDASHSVYHQVLCGVQSPCRADPSNARWGSCQGYTQAMDACEWCDAHIITLPPLPCLDERTQLSAKRSPLQRQTLARPSWWSRQNLDSSVNNTWDHCCLVHRTCCLAHVNLACLCPSFRRGFMAVFLDLNPLLWSRFRTVCTESPWRGLPYPHGFHRVLPLLVYHGIARKAALLRRSSTAVVILGLPERTLSFTSPVSRYKQMSL